MKRAVQVTALIAAVAFGYFVIVANQAHAQQPDAQQQLAAQSVVIAYLQKQADDKAAYINAANAEIEKLRKRIEELTPKKDEKK